MPAGSHSDLRAFSVGAATAFLAVPVCKRVAIRTGLVSHLRPDRWGRRETPLLGGLAVLSATTTASLLFCGSASLPLLCGAWTCFGLGLADDRRTFGPREKMIGVAAAYAVERIAALLVWDQDQPVYCADAGIPAGISAGASGATIARSLIALLEMAACVGGSNSFNLTDNMDGAAAGIGAISASALVGVWKVRREAPRGDPATGDTAALVPAWRSCFSAGLAGSCLGFLAWNAPPAGIFLGDAGSLPVGYILSRLSMGDRARPAAGVGRVFLVLAIPAADALFVLSRRMIKRRPLFKGGLDHLSHLLAQKGLEEPLPALCLLAAQTAACALAVRALPGTRRPAYGHPGSRGSFFWPGLAAVAGAGILLLAGRTRNAQKKRPG